MHFCSEGSNSVPFCPMSAWSFSGYVARISPAANSPSCRSTAVVAKSYAMCEAPSKFTSIQVRSQQVAESALSLGSSSNSIGKQQQQQQQHQSQEEGARSWSRSRQYQNSVGIQPSESSFISTNKLRFSSNSNMFRQHSSRKRRQEQRYPFNASTQTSATHGIQRKCKVRGGSISTFFLQEIRTTLQQQSCQ